MQSVAARPASFIGPGQMRFWPLVLIVLAGLLAYANSISAPFIFDDIDAIQENPTIRALGRAWSPPHDGSGVDSRPVVNLSLALNYAAGGLEVHGYHATNLAIHLLAGLTLFGVVRRTLVRAGEFAATSLALVAALLWTLHPLQTESVTVVIQRTESLMGLLYLSTLYGFIRAVADPDGRRWQVFSVAACLLGMGTKEVMVSAPLLVLLYDRTFVAGTFRSAWQQRRGYYAALAATWVLLVWLVASSGGARGGAAGTAAGITPWTYALTQCEAIGLYLKLSLWPDPLVLDYGTAVATSPLQVLPQGLLVVALVVGTLIALRRRPVWGFLGAWFLAILAPSTSFLPLVTQTIAEHRMYLPLAAVVVAGVLLAHRWLGRAGVPVGLALAVACASLTFLRNQDYRSAISIWEDNVQKVPGNARAHSNLGLALGAEGRTDEAMASLREAIRLQPDIPFAHYNLGLAFSRLNRDGEAVPQFEDELRLQPAYTPAWGDLGLSLYQLGRRDEAVAAYEKALRFKPDYPEALERLGVALASLGRLPEAVARPEPALRLRPDSPGIHQNLGIALALSGQLPQAIEHFERALMLDPSFAEAHLALARALTDAGRLQEAAVHREKAQGLLGKRKP
jgi:tetratricopeptide (TPR) repeat protein